MGEVKVEGGRGGEVQRERKSGTEKEKEWDRDGNIRDY